MLKKIAASMTLPVCTALLSIPCTAPKAEASEKKPNIVVIFTDDVGVGTISAYSRGLAGYQTPNIDRIANEGMLFTDYYAEQSSTAGRASFITGQTPLRSGLTKVGLPNAPLGLQADDATIAEVLQSLGYATAQFGKNNFGDRDEFLPTKHGFDEFYGILYPSSSYDELESPDYPKDPEVLKMIKPKGIIHSFAGGKTQEFDLLRSKDMPKFEKELVTRSIEFIRKQKEKDKPFFLWLCPLAMHYKTHVPDEKRGQAGDHLSIYADGMVEHDKNVGIILDELDKLGIADNTIVIYTSDNGPQQDLWPDAGISPFRADKVSSWEGAFRVPALIRWPAKIKANSVSNEIIASLDWLPTLAAAAGEPNIKDKMLKGYKANGKTFKLYLDGYNVLPHLIGKNKKSGREGFVYFGYNGDIEALRVNNFKFLFVDYPQSRAIDALIYPPMYLNSPKIFNLRTDPYERADHNSAGYNAWVFSNMSLTSVGMNYAMKHLQTYKDFPPSQGKSSFGLQEIVDMLSAPNRK